MSMSRPIFDSTHSYWGRTVSCPVHNGRYATLVQLQTCTIAPSNTGGQWILFSWQETLFSNDFRTKVVQSRRRAAIDLRGNFIYI